MKVELMAPAGNLEGAQLALENGADSIYAGMTNLSMRPKRVEFSEESFSDLVNYVHNQGKKIYATLNICLKPQDLEVFKKHLEEIYQVGVDGIIVSDLGAIAYIRSHYPDLPIHISIMTSVTNSEAARFYQELGASVIVISRSLNDLEELKRIGEAVGGNVDLEVFVHGGICYMFDGNCYMSSYWKQEWIFDEDLGKTRLLGQNNTKGECHLICKRHCTLTRNGSALAEGRLLRRPDQVGLGNLPFYIQLGIKIFKIEGRAMPLYYVAEATRLYRQAIDLYFQDPEKYCLQEEWKPAIKRLLEARLEYERQWHIK